MVIFTATLYSYTKVKKIDKLVLKTFAGPFVLTFMITLFIFVMQFLWKYIDDLVGKGLESYIIAELIFYASASFVPLVLPLAILLSSIMTYGNLGEHYELVALKAAGISLVRFMMPMFILVCIILVGAFGFSNYVLPQANLKFSSLLYDVSHQKPALNIKPGVFYSGIEGFSLLVGAKDADNRTIHDIIVYDHTSGQGNDNVLLAKKGEMFMSGDGRYLVLKLYDGSRYNEGAPGRSRSMEHYITSFTEWKKVFDLSEFAFDKSDESSWSDHYRMLNVIQLERAMDTIKMDLGKKKDEFNTNISMYYAFLRYNLDSIKVANASDSAFQAHLVVMRGDSIAGENKTKSMSRALSSARNVKSFGGAAGRDFHYHNRKLRKHDIEWHRKFTLSFACLVMFLIGAPLGAIIRVGGLGYPMLFSIIFFVIFHATSITSEKVAEEGGLTPGMAMWMATFILLPIGIFLTTKAVNDSPLFTFDWYHRIAKKVVKR